MILNKGAISKQDGSFQINNIPSGKYLVEISYIGYASNAQTINIKNINTKRFFYRQTAVEQEEVIVTGVSSATRIKQNPQPVSVIKATGFYKHACNKYY